MSYENLKVINSHGGIQGRRKSDGVNVYFAPNTAENRSARMGMYGDLQPYAPAPPPPVAPDQVKAEAARRILSICPEWKQRNLTAQAAILAAKGKSKWTAEEEAAWAAGEEVWGRIAAIRAASNVIEAMEPIPQDYTADRHWPA